MSLAYDQGHALKPSHAEIDAFVTAALAEDVGRGDVTSNALIKEDARGVAQVEFRAPGVVCGLPLVQAVFTKLDQNARFNVIFPEGCSVEAGVVARIEASTRALLTGERVALNILGRLSATATLTHAYAQELEGLSARIVDTRKTTPGLRALEKYAVRVGGGTNHRHGLDDGFLIKDNHIAAAGSITSALELAKASAPFGMRVELEVETLAQMQEGAAAGADFFLLDNMSLEEMRACVAFSAGRFLIEASGGVTLATVCAIGQTGVNFISAGALTHSAGTLDVALEITS